MSTRYCNKPTTNESHFCEDCIKEAIDANKDTQKQMQVSTYNDEHERLSKIAPESGKCSYRMARGEYKGWYCSKPCQDEEEYCETCHKRIIQRLYISHEQNNVSKGLCQRVVELI